MLARMISGFLVLFIVVTLVGPLSKEVNNIANGINCSQNTTSLPNGATNSFGGAGIDVKPHFGGYDGSVAHKPFYSTQPTDNSASNCIIDSSSAAALSFMLIIFLLAGILFIGLIIILEPLKELFSPSGGI